MGRVIFAIVLCLAVTIQARMFSRCQLVNELMRHGFPRDQLADWVCLVEAESARRTHVVGPVNTDGSYDHGLFQINDRYWCENGPVPGKDCQVTCSDITKDDIGAASECAQLIHGLRGFDAWVGWNNKCKGKTLPDLRPCGL